MCRNVDAPQEHSVTLRARRFLAHPIGPPPVPTAYLRYSATESERFLPSVGEACKVVSANTEIIDHTRVVSIESHVRRWTSPLSAPQTRFLLAHHKYRACWGYRFLNDPAILPVVPTTTNGCPFRHRSVAEQPLHLDKAVILFPWERIILCAGRHIRNRWNLPPC